ncbi:MAG: endonuclease/exonuclease/phosphatase family protein [Proteobacteria bacterium]|nr:endonuclease/exonuclease/phosphatase family protein [Pseudomonadota bacterium]
MRIATWNINSVRLRLPLIRRLIEAAAPDILCLQETKAEDVHFPTQALAELGFEHQMISGMKGYNGVAILSRRELRSTGTRSWCEKNDSRHVHADIDGGIELHCVYVPAGGDIPDPDANSKFAHKLRFVREQAEWWARQPTRAARRLLVGDLNIAPLENDVWSHKQLLDVVSHTPIEVDLLRRMQEAHGWVDAVRYFAPEPQRLYTWWSYRNRDWQASDRGRRLDHIWVTPALVPNLRAVHIFKGARDWPTPSDHVPVVVDLRL